MSGSAAVIPKDMPTEQTIEDEVSWLRKGPVVRAFLFFAQKGFQVGFSVKRT